MTMSDHKIIKLDKATANKIAAGEVVERPISIVKELLENAIDAGANFIIVEIKNGGKSYIRISDNGSGIGKSDVHMAFERSATSKIKVSEDLNHIHTLGFRGEALASIASVSNVEMITKTKDAELGIKVTLSGGNQTDLEEVGCVEGTTIIIRNLFFNTPVRLKFLKSDVAEASLITNVISKIALAYPKIAFKYIKNDQTIFLTNGKDRIENNIIDILGKEMLEKSMRIDETAGDIKIKGFIAYPYFTKGNRSHQDIYINGRYIKDELINQSILKGYGDLIADRKFPPCILFFEMPAEQVDVNVHPNKKEVRFSDETNIEKVIVDAIRKTLRQNNLIPSAVNKKTDIFRFGNDKKEEVAINKLSSTERRDLMQIFEMPKAEKVSEKESIFEAHKKEQNLAEKTMKPIIQNQEKKEPVFTEKIDSEPKKEEAKPILKPDIKIESDAAVKKEAGLEPKKEIVVEVKAESKTEIKPEQVKIQNSEPEQIELPVNNIFELLNPVGIAFNTYIICDDRDKLYIIDQHAAHERVNYESIKKSYRQEKIITQGLMTPIVLELNINDANVLAENLDIFRKTGYQIEPFGLNDYIIKGIPMLFGKPEAESFIHEMISQLINKSFSSQDLKLEKIISMACKRSIKANDALTLIEAKALIEQLGKTENPYTCPHGRPTIINLTKKEIEKMFNRT